MTVTIASGNASEVEARHAVEEILEQPVGDLVRQWRDDDLDWFEFATA